MAKGKNDKNKLTVRDCKEIQNHRDEVIKKANRAYKKLTDPEKEGMKALFDLRYQPIGYRPLRDGSLTIAEQMNQSFHALAVFAAADFIFDKLPDCGPLILSPVTGDGNDIESEKCGLVAGEAFSTVDPKFNGKLHEDAKKVSKACSQRRYVFFYSPNENPALVKEVEKEFPGVKIRPLSWDEMMARRGNL